MYKHQKTLKMKNSILKFYIVVFYLCSTFVLFAQPGTTDDTGSLESPDTPTAPIDDNLWILVLAGLTFIFIKLRSAKPKEIVITIDKPKTLE